MKKVIYNVYTITEGFFEDFQLENKLSLLVKDIQSRGRESYWVNEWNKHNERMVYIQNLINYIENSEEVSL